MFCTNCGARADGEYCGNCGAQMGGGDRILALRAAACLIDCIPALVAVAAVGWIPLIGAVLAGFILLSYWLLRDVTGASFGKIVLGLKVVRKDGSRASLVQRVTRNADLAVGPGILVIPFIGWAIAPGLSGLIFLAEAILLAARNERFGDRIAGTNVVKRAQAARAVRL